MTNILLTGTQPRHRRGDRRRARPAGRHAGRPRHGAAASPPTSPTRRAAAALWDAALDRLDGRIDVLINNAGIFEAEPDRSAA